MTAKDRILGRRARLVGAALAASTVTCGSTTKPQPCLDVCDTPSCGPVDSGAKDAASDATMDGPQVCLTMPPPDSGSDASDAGEDG